LNTRAGSSRTTNYGYSPKNSPCIVIHPNQGANITLIAAISIDGVLDFKIIDGACNADIFADYLSSNIWPKILGYDYSLLMDNARFHQSSIVRQTVPGACEINFIPPYSPQLNPIEEVFAEWKSQYSRLRPKTRPEAKEIIAMIGRNMASRSFSNYYNHMIFHLERCFQRLPLQNDG
jgi:transposase